MKGERFEKHALPNDVIRKSVGFQPRGRQDLFIPVLRNESAARLENHKDFHYVREDVARAKKEIALNAISLNREIRLAELREDEVRRKARRAEREERFAAVAKADRENLEIKRLTLDDLVRDVLPDFDPNDESEEYIRRAVDEVTELEENPEWPSGIDAKKREGLLILADLVEATRAATLAEVTENR